MSSLAATPSPGVPIPPDEIAAALRSVARPGYTGKVTLVLVVKVEALQQVYVDIRREESKIAAERESVPVVGDEPRKKSVQRVLNDIGRHLVLRTVMTALECHLVDGEVKKWNIAS